MKKPVFKLTSRVTVEEDNGANGGVLFDSHTAATSTCNDTALVLLQALKKGGNVETLSKLLMDQFDVKEKEARADVVALLKDLTQQEYVREQA
ncbi:PqqD family protein [Magnetovibrio sp. PR-2]|uniref:PqqD family protein n=1 Tax=Magnetovibrio sp. PR-2 TaxID=3120356 RepID=UPI002FCE5748